MASETVQAANPAQRLCERLAPGTRFTYVDNTLHAYRGGSRFIGAEMVVKSGKWVKDVDVVGMDGGFRMAIPTAAKRVEWLDDSTVRYEIVNALGHYVTLRLSAVSA